MVLVVFEAHQMFCGDKQQLCDFQNLSEAFSQVNNNNLVEVSLAE